MIDTTDQAGRVTHNVYDLAGRLTSVTSAYGTADAATTSYTYYDDGRKATETDPRGHTTTYNYDPAGRLTSVVDAVNHTTAYGYDDAGNQTSVTDANTGTMNSQLRRIDGRRLRATVYRLLESGRADVARKQVKSLLRQRSRGSLGARRTLLDVLFEIEMYSDRYVDALAALSRRRSLGFRGNRGQTGSNLTPRPPPPTPTTSATT